MPPMHRRRCSRDHRHLPTPPRLLHDQCTLKIAYLGPWLAHVDPRLHTCVRNRDNRHRLNTRLRVFNLSSVSLTGSAALRHRLNCSQLFIKWGYEKGWLIGYRDCWLWECPGPQGPGFEPGLFNDACYMHSSPCRMKLKVPLRVPAQKSRIDFVRNWIDNSNSAFLVSVWRGQGWKAFQHCSWLLFVLKLRSLLHLITPSCYNCCRCVTFVWCNILASF